MAFKKATKRDAILRFAIMGPAGSGKTRTALELATRLGKRVAVIDSEGGRSRAYAGRFDFDVDDELPDYSPDSYVKAIKAAEAADYDVIIVDSASHEWAGKGGVLGKVDVAASKSGNKWAAWAVGTPAHQTFIDAVIQCGVHIILTLRSKTEWVLEQDSRGKQVPKAVGLGAVQRDGTEYEVDFVGQMDLEHRLTIIKTTDYAELEGRIFEKPGDDLAAAMKAWLADRPAPAPKPAPKPPAAIAAVPSPSDAAVPQASPEAGKVADAIEKLNIAAPLLAKIAAAKDQAELDALVPECGKLPEAERAVVRAAWMQRQVAISSKAA